MATRSDTINDARSRLVRFAGWSGLLWTVFQLTVLALTAGQRGWQWQSVALNVLPVFLLSVAVLRGSAVAAILFGAYGAYRVVTASIVFARWMNGTAAQTYEGLVWEIAVVMVFAVIWLIGGVSTVAHRYSRRVAN